MSERPPPFVVILSRVGRSPASEAIASIRCPTCGAPSGEICETPSGKLRDYPHASRVAKLSAEPKKRAAPKSRSVHTVSGGGFETNRRKH